MRPEYPKLHFKNLTHPLFARFVDHEAVICVVNDGDRTYLNLNEEIEVEHHMVNHNQCFINPQKVEKYIIGFDKTVQIKVHTNSVEGEWRVFKPHLNVKRGVRLSS